VSTVLPGAYYTIEVDGRPTIVFHAERFAHARELAREQWLRDDLNELRSNGQPVCTLKSKLTARAATDEEIATFLSGSTAAKPNGDEIVIAYLVELDGIPKTWGD
jgi:hypothetical protein